MKKTYELMLVVKPEADVTDKTAKGIVEKLLGEDASVSEVKLLGKKPLAYPIKKFTEAHYIQAAVTHPHLSVHEIEKKVQLGSDVLRFLITVKQK